MMKFLSAIMLTLSTSVSLAVEVQQGQVYPGGTYVESSQTGVGLIIPRGILGTQYLILNKQPRSKLRGIKPKEIK